MCYTPFLLQAVYPMVINIWQNTPVLQLLSEDCMLPCDTVANAHYLAHSTEVIKCSKFCTVTMCRWDRASADQFFATVTEGVVHSVDYVVTPSSFSVTQQHKVNGSNRCFATVSQSCIWTLDDSWRTGAFCPMPLTANYTARSLNDTPNLARYVASLEAVPQPSKTSLGCTVCSVKGALTKKNYSLYEDDIFTKGWVYSCLGHPHWDTRIFWGIFDIICTITPTTINSTGSYFHTSLVYPWFGPHQRRSKYTLRIYWGRFLPISGFIPPGKGLGSLNYCLLYGFLVLVEN